MTFLTGDTHGQFDRIDRFCIRMKTNINDVMVILGDAGLNYDRAYLDVLNKAHINAFSVTTFCIHGNHEIRPQNISSYRVTVFHNGKVLYGEAYPNIVFAIDGEVYDFDGYKCIAIGGAYSADKLYRLERGLGWWGDEQPSDEVKAAVEKRLVTLNWKIDIVMSHTCPKKYVPTPALFMRNKASTDESTEEWLGKLEKQLQYRKWYCGHYHIIRKVERLQFMYADFDVMNPGRNTRQKSKNYQTSPAPIPEVRAKGKLYIE